MKTSLRDSLLIATALFTILGCGFGLGRLGTSEPAALAPTAPVDQLGGEVLDSLRQSLDLTAEQEAVIQPELGKLTTGILDSRQESLFEYYKALLQFHEDISPKLSPRQQSLLEANQELLEKEFHDRFPASP